MDIITGHFDPYVTSEIISAMGKELKLTRSKIKELESLRPQVRFDMMYRWYRSPKQSPKEYKLRAETAEQALDTLKTRFEEISTENHRLREEMRRNESIVKRSEGTTRKESQSMDVDADIVENLRDELETYRERYHAERDAKIRLREDYNYLKIQRAQEQRDYQNLKDMFEKECATRIEPAGSAVINPLAIQECVPIQQVFKYMATTYPKYQPRPSNKSLLPVFTDFNDLKTWISSPSTSHESHYQKLKKQMTVICLPNRVAWCPSNETHGLAFGPMRVSCNNNWTEHDTTTFKQKTIHLFFAARCSVYYAGLYNVIELVDEFPEGISVKYSREPEWKALSRVTPKDQEAKVEIVLDKLGCKEGLVKPLGLQCAGFDYKVYRLLTKRFSYLHSPEEPKSKKRKRN